MDGTSFYRGIGPLAHLKKNAEFYGFNTITVDSAEKFKWATLYQYDMVFMQRPFREEHKQVAEMAKTMSIPLWVDYDDDLFNVSTDNPSHVMYGKEGTKKVIHDIIKIADTVTVSTEAIKRSYDRFNDNVIVINNAIDLDLFKYRKSNEHNVHRNNLVMWRGSPTHQKDVMSVANEILDFHDKNPDTLFEFIGDRMWIVSDQMKKDQLIITDWKDVMLYHHHIYSVVPKVFIVPLVMNTFNACKSNIAWLEASFAGALTIAPKIPEFDQPGVFTYTDREGFYNALEQTIGMDELQHQRRLNESWEYIMKKFTLRVVNYKRADVVRSLL